MATPKKFENQETLVSDTELIPLAECKDVIFQFNVLGTRLIS